MRTPPTVRNSDALSAGSGGSAWRLAASQGKRDSAKRSRATASPEVEFVVAGHGEVHPRRVPGPHHLRPLEQPGLDAGRQRVAAEQEERGRMLGTQLAHQPGEARQPAARRLGVDRRDLVDVIDMDQADLDDHGRPALRLGGQGQAEEQQ
jgi:hypothetical protein